MRLASNLPSLAVSSSGNVKCRSMKHQARITYAHSLSSATEQINQTEDETQYCVTGHWILVIDLIHAHEGYKEML